MAIRRLSSPIYQPQIPAEYEQPQSGMASVGNAAMGLLSAIFSPVIRTGARIGGAGVELARAGGLALPDRIVDPSKLAFKNPFLSEENLNEYSNNPSKAVFKALTDSAGTLSLAVPAGGGSIGRSLLMGGAAGGLGGVSNVNKEDDAATILGKILTGAGTGAAVGGGLAAAGKGINLLKNLRGKVQGAGQGVARDAATRALKGTPSMYQKAIESGVDVKDVVLKEGLDPNPSKALSQIKVAMREAEKPIQSTIKAAGSNVRLFGDDIVKRLRSELRVLKQGYSKEKVKALESVIAQIERKYAKGVSANQALKTLRLANSKFGKSILDDSVDVVARDAQKIEANVLRDTLKTLFPDVADGLDREQGLIVVREFFNKARAKGEANVFKFGQFEVTRPGTVIDRVLDNEGVQRAAMSQGQKGKVLTSLVPDSRDALIKEAEQIANKSSRLSPQSLGRLEQIKTLLPEGQQSQIDVLLRTLAREPLANARLKAGQVVNQGVQTAGTRALPSAISGRLMTQGAEEPIEGELIEPTGIEGADLGGGMGQDDSIITPQMAALMILLAPEKAGAIQSVYELLNPVTKEKAKTEAQVARDEAGSLVETAIAQLEGGGVQTGPISPRLQELLGIVNLGDQPTLDFDATISTLKAAIAKARAGTSFTPNEERLLNRYTPNVGDSAQQLRTKLVNLQKIFSRQTGAVVGNQAPELSILTALMGQ